MGNRYLQEVTEIVRKQQGKRGPVWMCGEQLLEMIAAEEDATKLVLDDLTHGGMSLEKCEKKIRKFAREHDGCCTGMEGEMIIRKYFGLPDAQRAPEQEQTEKPADDGIDLEAFF
nr:MAG TPA: hypothetical protein [Caudoviricetes sp.]